MKNSEAIAKIIETKNSTDSSVGVVDVGVFISSIGKLSHHSSV